MDQQREAQIIVRILKGERQAYALLIDEYKKPIYNLAFRMTKNAEDADDLAQETFIRAYKNLWRFNPEKKFFTWLYTISLNLIRNHLKKLRGDELKARVIFLYSENVDRSPENILIDAEKLKEIELRLLNLSDEARALIIMKYQQELSFEEVAEITAKSVSAVKMIIYRNLDKLKNILEK
jgi:RNA polymerase sigma-70 factor (ECF subfamily)